MKTRRALSSIVGALIAIMILVNSIVIIEKYSDEKIKIIERKVELEKPSPLRILKINESSLLLINDGEETIDVKYIVYDNGTVSNLTLAILPKKELILENPVDNIRAVITGDSHIVYVTESISNQTNFNGYECLQLSSTIELNIGSDQSPVIRYTLEPSINSVAIAENYNLGKTGLTTVDMDELGDGRILVFKPIQFSTTTLNYTINKWDQSKTLIILVENGSIKEESIAGKKYVKTLDKNLSETNEIKLYPFTWMLSNLITDDEKFSAQYNISFASYIRTFYLYVNGEVHAVLQKQNLMGFSKNIAVNIERLNETHLSFELHDGSYIYSSIIPIAVISLNWKGYTDISAKMRLIISPDIIVVPRLHNDFYMSFDDWKGGVVKISLQVKPYELSIFNPEIRNLNSHFHLQDNGSIIYDSELGSNVILIYLYQENKTILRLETYVSIVILYRATYGYYGYLYIIPYMDKPPISFVSFDPARRMLLVETMKQNYSFDKVYLPSGYNKIYIYLPKFSNHYLLYNYNEPIGNAYIYYPERIGNNVLPYRIVNISGELNLKFKQIDIINGSISKAEVCLRNHMGYVNLEGEPGSKVLVVLPHTYQIQPNSLIEVGENYVIVFIPDGGKIRVSFTIESVTPHSN